MIFVKQVYDYTNGYRNLFNFLELAFETLAWMIVECSLYKKIFKSFKNFLWLEGGSLDEKTKPWGN